MATDNSKTAESEEIKLQDSTDVFTEEEEVEMGLACPPLDEAAFEMMFERGLFFDLAEDKFFDWIDDDDDQDSSSNNNNKKIKNQISMDETELQEISYTDLFGEEEELVGLACPPVDEAAVEMINTVVFDMEKDQFLVVIDDDDDQDSSNNNKKIQKQLSMDKTTLQEITYADLFGEEEEVVRRACPPVDETELEMINTEVFDMEKDQFFVGIDDDDHDDQDSNNGNKTPPAETAKTTSQNPSFPRQPLQHPNKVKENPSAGPAAGSMPLEQKPEYKQAAKAKKGRQTQVIGYTGTTTLPEISKPKIHATTKRGDEVRVEVKKVGLACSPPCDQGCNKTAKTATQNCPGLLAKRVEQNRCKGKDMRALQAVYEESQKTGNLKDSKITDTSKGKEQNPSAGSMSFEQKFECAKRKLQDGYEQAAKEKKQRQIRVIDFPGLPSSSESKLQGKICHQQLMSSNPGRKTANMSQFRRVVN